MTKLDSDTIITMLDTFSDPYVVSGISYYVIADLCYQTKQLLEQMKEEENGD